VYARAFFRADVRVRVCLCVRVCVRVCVCVNVHVHVCLQAEEMFVCPGCVVSGLVPSFCRKQRQQSRQL